MTYHSSRVCAYCKSGFMGHSCPNCGAPYTAKRTDEVRYGFDGTPLRAPDRYTFEWTDPHAFYGNSFTSR